MALRKLRGETALVSHPTIGTVVARCDRNGWWELRRADPQPEDAVLVVWSLRAVFDYVNPDLFFVQRDLQEFTVNLGGKLYRLDMPTDRMALDGRSLQAEGVTMWPVDEPLPTRAAT